MSDTQKNIKDYSKNLWAFVLLNLCIFILLAIHKDFNLSNLDQKYTEIAKYGVIGAISSLITFILNGFLSSNVKATLVFWRIKHVLPGCRVFTSLIRKDPRIDRSVLVRRFGELPVESEKQNQLWYKIFKPMEFDPMIFDSHRNFLLSRDLTALSFLFIMIYSVASLIFRIDSKIMPQYIAFLVFQYVILALVARNYGNRFALNVLARTCISENISNNNTTQNRRRRKTLPNKGVGPWQ